MNHSDTVDYSVFFVLGSLGVACLLAGLAAFAILFGLVDITLPGSVLSSVGQGMLLLMLGFSLTLGGFSRFPGKYNPFF